MSGALILLNSPNSDNWIRFSSFDVETGRIGFHDLGGYGNLEIRNNKTGFGDLIVLRGGNSGKFWMYPDGILYANNLENIGDHHNMQWNPTTGEIGWDSSTRRHKMTIMTLKDDWSKILQTRPVKFNRPHSPDHWEYGYIAEEMDSIGLSNLVGYGVDGLPNDVKYEKIVLYLTEMIKVQHEILAEQGEEIERLKKKVDYLDAFK